MFACAVCCMCSWVCVAHGLDGALADVADGKVFDNLAAIQKIGSHSHTGYHGRAVSSSCNPTPKTSIARGVQSLIDCERIPHSTLSLLLVSRVPPFVR